MKIDMVNINELIPYASNPRLNDESVQYVKESIERFGFKVPIVVDQNNVIIAGHTRLKAAKELDLKEVPVIRAEDLNEEEVTAYRLADNKVSEFSQWDMNELKAELAQVTTIDMEKYGFFDLEEELEAVQEEETLFEEKDVIVIEFENEEDLHEALVKFNDEGYTCRVETRN